MIVEVYKNLHKKLYSIRSNKTGLVVGHSQAVAVRNATLVVQAGGRERVLREQRKNVHAFVKGERISFDFTQPELAHLVFEEITYNPHKNSSFVYKGTNTPVRHADLVVLWPGGVYACGIV